MTVLGMGPLRHLALQVQALGHGGWGIDVRTLAAGDVVAALNDVGIGEGWGVADAVRSVAREHPEMTGLGLLAGSRLGAPNAAFRNLVVGMIAERLFLEQCLAPLVDAGFTVRDFRAVGDNRDFVLEKDGITLPVNVKVSATPFRSSESRVGLAPDDCLSISSYKAFNATRSEPDLLFVSLVDHSLRPRVDAFMEGLAHDPRGRHSAIVWDLLSWYGGKELGRGSKRAQDTFIDDLFRRYGRDLRALADQPARFRAISARRVLDILRDNLNRCPALVQRGAFTGGDPQIHISAATETSSWAEVAAMLADEGIFGVLERIRHTSRRTQTSSQL